MVRFKGEILHEVRNEVVVTVKIKPQGSGIKADINEETAIT